jgi:prepilin-type N-terminal cleavage/methylation domain-containing protein
MNSNSRKTDASKGYTIIELMVALVVSAIVIAGTYAGYSFFKQQHELLTKKTALNRNTLKAIDLIQSDIHQAGFKDYASSNAMISTQPIRINPLLSAPQTSGSDFTVAFDDWDSTGTYYRALIRYYLTNYTPPGISTTGTRQRLMRDWRKCTTPANECFITNSTPMYTLSMGGEPILDWVQTFNVIGLNPENTGSFLGQFQTLQIQIVVGSPNKIEGTTKTVTKTFTFLARAKNVSLVP